MQLGLPEPKPTTMTLQLADRSVTYPRGIVEDVLVKVDKLIFPADFVILDFEEDKKIPIILGRPFLATGRTLIDVQKGELTMRVQDQTVSFNVFKATKLPTENEQCFRLEVVDTGKNEAVEEVVSWAKLEDTEIKAFLEEEVLLEHESTKELQERYRNFSSDEMLEELNAICSRHETKLEYSSFVSKSVDQTAVDIANTNIARLEEWAGGTPKHRKLGCISESAEGDSPHTSLGLADLMNSQVRLKPSYESPFADMYSVTLERLEDWPSGVPHLKGLSYFIKSAVGVFGAHHLPPEEGGDADDQ
jgi:hypothetical protein